MSAIYGSNPTPCPCGGEFYVTYDRDGRAIGLAHGVPPCERYIALDVTEFLVYVRETAERMN